MQHVAEPCQRSTIGATPAHRVPWQYPPASSHLACVVARQFRRDVSGMGSAVCMRVAEQRSCSLSLTPRMHPYPRPPVVPTMHADTHTHRQCRTKTHTHVVDDMDRRTSLSSILFHYAHARCIGGGWRGGGATVGRCAARNCRWYTRTATSAWCSAIAQPDGSGAWWRRPGTGTACARCTQVAHPPAPTYGGPTWARHAEAPA